MEGSAAAQIEQATLTGTLRCASVREAVGVAEELRASTGARVGLAPAVPTRSCAGAWLVRVAMPAQRPCDAQDAAGEREIAELLERWSATRFLGWQLCPSERRVLVGNASIRDRRSQREIVLASLARRPEPDSRAA